MLVILLPDFREDIQGQLLSPKGWQVDYKKDTHPKEIIY
jgi:hypothetical protein